VQPSVKPKRLKTQETKTRSEVVHQLLQIWLTPVMTSGDVSSPTLGEKAAKKTPSLQRVRAKFSHLVVHAPAQLAYVNNINSCWQGILINQTIREPCSDKTCLLHADAGQAPGFDESESAEGGGDESESESDAEDREGDQDTEGQGSNSDDEASTVADVGSNADPSKGALLFACSLRLTSILHDWSVSTCLFFDTP
jgi:hypothetical protein